MRKPFIKAISVILLSSVVVVGLTGCNPYEIYKPDETQMKSAKQELQERGFTDPRWEDNLGSFTVGVGTCRLPIRQGADDWTITVPTDSGISADIRHANLTMLESYPPIEACFGE